MESFGNFSTTGTSKGSSRGVGDSRWAVPRQDQKEGRQGGNHTQHRPGLSGEMKEEGQEAPPRMSANIFRAEKLSRPFAATGQSSGGGGGSNNGSFRLDKSGQQSQRSESMRPELENSTSEMSDSLRSFSLAGSTTSSSTGFRRWRKGSGSTKTGSSRKGKGGMLGGLKKGMGAVLEKLQADHPEPVPIDKSLSKEEQKAKHRQMEMIRRNDWTHNSMAEQHVLHERVVKDLLRTQTKS